MIYKGDYKITSPFGPRNIYGDKRYHNGVDLVGTDKTILAPCDGVIKSSTIITNKSNTTWEWGNYVRLDTLDGHRLFFCHLSSRNAKVGQRVKKGDIIGIEGNTGYSFGSHCHFEVRAKDNKSINPIEYLESINKSNREIVQEKCEFEDSTMNYLDKHPYPDVLYKKIVEAIDR